MAVTMPLIPILSPRAKTRTLKGKIERMISSEEKTNSQLFDSFLESCSGTAPTHLTSACRVPLIAFKSTILTLPPDIIRKILRNLLTSPTPLILQPDLITTAQEYRTYVKPNVLQICKVFHNIGIPILYGENTLTTSSPTTSFDFDKHLLSLPGSRRQMITDVKLEIGWADQLWAKFPLVARALGELKSLHKLEIVLVETEKVMEENRTASIEEDANLEIMITYGEASASQERTPRRRTPAIDRVDRQVKREGPIADTMLKAEMNMLKDLVTGFKGLKDFRLIGFRHEVFAWCLEDYVRIGNR